MAQSLGKILLHIVFSTKGRRPFFANADLRADVHHYLGGILTKLDCQAISIGGVEDHVHILCALARTCTAADLVKELKRSSSIWVKGKDDSLREFAWQVGYGVFSIGYSQIEEVRAYIAGQEERHRKVSFQDEYRKLLTRYAVGFDERFVWD